MSVDEDGFGYMVLDPGALRVDPPSWVVPHEFAHVVTYHMGGGTANGWYDAWPILLYITENPDNMQGLGLDLMKKILKDSSTGTMFDKIERLSGTPLKEILGGYSKRMVTYDFKRQDRYKVRLNYLE